MFVYRCVEKLSVNFVQIRGRRRVLNPPVWLPKKYKSIRASLNKDDR